MPARCKIGEGKPKFRVKTIGSGKKVRLAFCGGSGKSGGRVVEAKNISILASKDAMSIAGANKMKMKSSLPLNHKTDKYTTKTKSGRKFAVAKTPSGSTAWRIMAK